MIRRPPRLTRTNTLFPYTTLFRSGLGDLVLTSTGDLSRNRRLGLAPGRGQSLQDAVREIGQVVESVQTADEVMRLADRYGLELPISPAVRDVLHGAITPAQALARLLPRAPKPAGRAEKRRVGEES